MPCGLHVSQVDVRILEFKHRARIGEDVTLIQVRQYDSEPRRRLADCLLYPANIDTSNGQSLERHLPESIATRFRNETDLVPQRSQVMGKNCGRTAQSKREAAGQQFPVQHELFRQAIEDQVQVDFTNHAYVQCRHVSPMLLASAAPALTLLK